MKSLFQNIRTGVITKAACEKQLAQFSLDKSQLNKDFLGQRLGKDLYTKKLAELNFCIEMLKSIVDKYDDLRLPLKTKLQSVGTEPDEPATAYDQVSGRALDDEGPNFSTEG